MKLDCKLKHNHNSQNQITEERKQAKTNQPVSGGKANIHPTDPPPDVEPNVPSITELREPQKEAEKKPREEHHNRGFQEHSLRLRELLDGVEGEERLG